MLTLAGSPQRLAYVESAKFNSVILQYRHLLGLPSLPLLTVSLCSHTLTPAGNSRTHRYTTYDKCLRFFNITRISTKDAFLTFCGILCLDCYISHLCNPSDVIDVRTVSWHNSPTAGHHTTARHTPFWRCAVKRDRLINWAAAGNSGNWSVPNMSREKSLASEWSSVLFVMCHAEFLQFVMTLQWWKSPKVL